ncbi:Signal transduction histidine kinase [Prauserella flava]|uniref:histidine kinase n=2 Tax=Prauserella salsuginis group TaxID=2893672 RepID=A0A839XCP3_9PSEU|nr:MULTISPECIES: sensor domain-containing protein [Prauserella salsuginis group]MBB3661732.1 signal transduction histidine kinase [Prauserella sediminis]MCR3719643.1 Signal transduction histidine kinase [Prauserella flava]MCR3735343.1 Signal transduction histidine kinase [Prauserella salsuginis]
MMHEDQPWPGTWRTIAYQLLTLPVRIVEFVVLLVLLVAGIATTIVWVGIPLLMLATTLTHRFADFERRSLRRWLRTPLPDAIRNRGDGPVRNWFAQLTDATTWRDLAYLLITTPLAIVEFVLGVVSAIIVPLALTVAPGVGWLHGKLALTLLGPPRAERLEAKATRLQASRARGVDAAENERRRIERDLHDGAQQRLVSVAMTVGRAKAKIGGTEPDTAELQKLLDEAHTDAKLAVSELRDLARGIYPAVLGDRGLDAALSALAAKSPVPVSVSVDIDQRPPAAVESTTYFVVGETLTNAAKYADASDIRVDVRRDGDTVIAEVTDDGHGGAEIRPGGGLAGLADRAATIDGVVSVVSPAGGPTVVRAELPCSW